MKMNHRGQTLVLFILLLPVLLLVLGFLVDMGYLYMEKRKINRTVDMVLDYGVTHADATSLEQEMQQLLILNLKTLNEQNIVMDENHITVTVSKTVDGIFPFLFQEKSDTIRVQKTKQKNLEE